MKPVAVLSRRTLIQTSLSLLPAACLIGQDAQKPSFSTDVKVVNVFATVRDKDGKIATDLVKDDFFLEEDGRPQTIRYFSKQSDLPLTLGLLVDTSASERRMLSEERTASEKFFEHVLRPDRDKAFLIHFDREVELLQDLTSSRERLEKALALLQTREPDQSQSNGGGGSSNPGNNGGWGGGGGGWGGAQRRPGGGPGSHARHQGGTALYDAVLLSSDELMSKQTGRKAIILLTDGEDNGSKSTVETAISSAQRSDTLAFSVRIADQNSGGFAGPGMNRRGGWGRGPGDGINRPDGKKILQQVSSATGGAYFEVSKKKNVDEIYSQIADELRNQYNLGYVSDQPPSDGAYRAIRVSVKSKKDLIVQARQGYFSKA